MAKTEKKVKKKVLEERESKRNLVEHGSKEEQQQVEALMQKITDMEMDMSNFTAKGTNWLANWDKEQAANKMNGMSQMYQQRMMMMCAMPLTQGLHADTVIQSVGMYVGMSLVNPKFRKDAKKSIANAKGTLYDTTAQMLESGEFKKGWSDEKRAKYVDKLKTYRDKAMTKANMGRTPYSPESAAITEMRLTMDAYHQMRVPGADIDKIRSDFTDARNTLYEMANIDGLTPGDIQQSYRTMVGKFCDADPNAQYVFAETGYGDVQKADFHEETLLKQDKKGNIIGSENINVWSGEFVYGDGKDFNGQFHIREPLTLDKFANTQALIMDDGFNHVTSAKDLNTMMKSMMYSSNNYSMMDKEPIPNDVQADSVSSKIASEHMRYMEMAVQDGFSRSEIDEVTSTLFDASLKDFAASNPDIVKEWQDSYSAEWASAKKENRQRRYPNGGETEYGNEPDMSTNGRGSQAEQRFGTYGGSSTPEIDYGITS